MAKSLDRTSRFLFPLSFALLSLIYWSYLFYTDSFDHILQSIGGTDSYKPYGEDEPLHPGPSGEGPQKKPYLKNLP